MIAKLPSTNSPLLTRCVAMATCRHDDSYTYALPYRESEAYRVSQGYGGSHSHTDHAHFSIDFSMPVGTVICATRGGVVSRVVDHHHEGGPDKSYASKWNVIEIIHSDLSVAAYGHLSEDGSLVTVGDSVSRGDPIAISGNTGWSRGPHLHFHVTASATPERVPVLFATHLEERDTLVRDVTYYHPGHPLLPQRQTMRRTMRWTGAASALLQMVGLGSPPGQR